ncbi:MAG: MOSC domain-containing protein [Bacteroidetes bacterium]|nr:MOSC domain-containing protein [Bacteroidota bacterium]MDA1118974.1 MOSC domain-containing protein [Bacteroidota bacterium]
MEESGSIVKELLNTIPQTGQVVWIGLRPGRKVPMEVVSKAEAIPGLGLSGDRFKGTVESKRQVTLIQHEHLSVIENIIGMKVDPAILRRNIVIEGINLLSLHNQTFRIGEVIFEGTGYCHPCSNMESALGKGGYNAMRGHGGITARVLSPGSIRVNDALNFIEVRHDR